MTGNFLGNALSQIQQRSKLQNLLYGSFGSLAVLGIAVIAAHKAYHHYISSQWPMYFLSGSLIALAGVGMTLVLKEHFQSALYVLALALLPVFATAFMVRTDVEGFVSSHEASAYVPQRPWGVTMVLTSKNNARGITVLYRAGGGRRGLFRQTVFQSSPGPYFRYYRQDHECHPPTARDLRCHP